MFCTLEDCGTNVQLGLGGFLFGGFGGGRLWKEEKKKEKKKDWISLRTKSFLLLCRLSTVFSRFCMYRVSTKYAHFCNITQINGKFIRFVVLCYCIKNIVNGRALEENEGTRYVEKYYFLFLFCFVFLSFCSITDPI